MAKKVATNRYGPKGERLREGESFHKTNQVYMFRWSDSFGNRHQIYRKDLKELRAEAEKIRRDLSDGIKIREQNITINDVYRLWLQDKVGLKDSTKSNYKYMYEHFIMDSFGTLKIQSVRKSDVRRFYNGMIGESRTKVKINTLEIIHNVLHQVFKLALEDGLLRSDPTDGVLTDCKRAHNFETPKRHALTIPEQTAFLEYVKKTPEYRHWLPLFTTLLGTGLRIGELAGLRWEDVQMDGDFPHIRIDHSLTYFQHEDGKCGHQISTPKTSAGIRAIPLLPEVKQALLEEQSYQKEIGLTCNCTVNGYTNFIFLNRNGNNHNQSSVNRGIKRILRSYNLQEMDKAEEEGREAVLLPNFSCHNFRHTFATRLCENESNLKVIQSVLGHADVSTTMNIYVDVTEAKLNTSFENLAGKIYIG